MALGLASDDAEDDWVATHTSHVPKADEDVPDIDADLAQPSDGPETST